MGFYGNWKQDTGERSGPLGVVLAKQLGRGRIVILGDQNMMGDPFINYADNYRLWLNSVSWLTGDSRLANVDPYLNWRPRIRFYDQYVHSAFGNSDSDGFYNIFAAVGRRMWAFAGDDLTSQQVIVFADTNCTLSGDDLAAVIRHLRARRAIVVLGPAITADAPLPALLSQIGAKLGKPVVDSDPTKQTCRWPGYGRLIILKGHEVYQNGFVPPPETAPDEHQQVLLNTVISTLENAMKDAVPALLKGRVANAHPAPLPGAHPIWRAKTGTQSPVS
jgi:hypothetical protein